MNVFTLSMSLCDRWTMGDQEDSMQFCFFPFTCSNHGNVVMNIYVKIRCTHISVLVPSDVEFLQLLSSFVIVGDCLLCTATCNGLSDVMLGYVIPGSPGWSDMLEQRWIQKEDGTEESKGRFQTLYHRRPSSRNNKSLTTW